MGSVTSIATTRHHAPTTQLKLASAGGSSDTPAPLAISTSTSVQNVVGTLTAINRPDSLNSFAPVGRGQTCGWAPVAGDVTILIS